MDTNDEFCTKLNNFIFASQQKLDTYYYRDLPTLDVPRLKIVGGLKYIKIALIRDDDSRRVWAFVKRDNGDVLMPASWKAPAKHARGNIFADDNGASAVDPNGTGIRYLK